MSSLVETIFISFHTEPVKSVATWGMVCHINAKQHGATGKEVITAAPAWVCVCVCFKILILLAKGGHFVK